MKLLDKKSVATMLDMSVATFDRKVRGHPDFPKAYNVTGSPSGYRWAQDEVAEWISNQKKVA